jgi:hypothetical protein
VRRSVGAGPVADDARLRIGVFPEELKRSPGQIVQEPIVRSAERVADRRRLRQLDGRGRRRLRRALKRERQEDV